MEVTKASSIVLTPKQYTVSSTLKAVMHRWLTVRFMTAVIKTVDRKSKAKELLDNGKITATINEYPTCTAASSNHHRQLSNQLDEDRDFARQMGIPRLPFQQQKSTTVWFAERSL